MRSRLAQTPLKRSAMAVEDLDLQPVHPPESTLRTGELVLRMLLLFALLFGFLVAIETMSKAIRGLAESGILGSRDSGELFSGVSNPFAGLAIGVLFTVLVQSSSTTTSTIVAVVGSGTLSVEHAVPMILGANIGTTITNTLVSIGHVRREAEFQRAFAAATVHDFFNLILVAIFLPLEIATGLLSRCAGWLSARLAGGPGAEFDSPIKGSIKTVHGLLVDLVESLGLAGAGMQAALLALGIGLTFVCLYSITKNMRVVIAGKMEQRHHDIMSANVVIHSGAPPWDSSSSRAIVGS